MKGHSILMWLIVAIGSLFTSLCFASTNANQSPQEPMGRLVLAMSTDNAEIVDGAITIGTVALKRGHPVTMLLRLESIKVALTTSQYPIGDTTLARKLAKFIRNGAQVMVGGHCMKVMKLHRSDLLNGVTVGTPDRVMGTLFSQGVRILSY